MSFLQLAIIPDYLRDLNILSIILRFLLAALCGGIIGAEREHSRHPAGLRTHLLVCIGAASCMMVNQYISTYLTPGSDMGRIGAQVVSGIGFLGAGTILVTRQSRISGLTTAAALWASACMGLTAGIGFYECTIILCVLMFIVLAVLSKLNTHFANAVSAIRVYVEFGEECRLGQVLALLKEADFTTSDIDTLPSSGNQVTGLVLILEKRPSIGEYKNTLEQIRALPGMYYADRI
ncbi:MAG: MgtC/SapB family protein [Oscillospiraceae bacterium]|nr:MgtC/SapB family protein [Oscillospiraceae bacterium]